MDLSFTVLGKPQPAGSKRAFAVRKGGVPTGRIAVVDANKNAKPWQAEVRAAAADAMVAVMVPGSPVWTTGFLEGPLNVSMTFYAARPKSHYRTGKNSHLLKDSAPPMPTGRPDALKLARGTEDALTGVVWRDDAQVVALTVFKVYGFPERCEVRVSEWPATEEAA